LTEIFKSKLIDVFVETPCTLGMVNIQATVTCCKLIIYYENATVLLIKVKFVHFIIYSVSQKKHTTLVLVITLANPGRFCKKFSLPDSAKNLKQTDCYIFHLTLNTLPLYRVKFKGSKIANLTQLSNNVIIFITLTTEKLVYLCSSVKLNAQSVLLSLECTHEEVDATHQLLR